MQLYNAELVTVPPNAVNYSMKNYSSTLFKPTVTVVNGIISNIPEMTEAVDVYIRNNETDDNSIINMRFHVHNQQSNSYYGNNITLRPSEEFRSTKLVIRDVLFTNNLPMAVSVYVILVGR